VQLDHVLFAVEDLVGGARAFPLVSFEGGRHPDWGTANRIVPLGDAYLELVGVVDHDEAVGTTFGRRVGAAAATPPRPFAWCVRARNLDLVASGLGLTVDSGRRTRPDGSVLEWRLAGVEKALVDPVLPFFIEWAPGSAHPGASSAPVGTIDHVQLSGSRDRIDRWLGAPAAELPISVEEGPSAVLGVRIRGNDGRVVELGG
jgi:hypothetical protein